MEHMLEKLYSHVTAYLPFFLFFRPDFSFQEHIYCSESKPKMLLKRGGGSFDELQVCYLALFSVFNKF